MHYEKTEERVVIYDLSNGQMGLRKFLRKVSRNRFVAYLGGWPEGVWIATARTRKACQRKADSVVDDVKYARTLSLLNHEKIATRRNRVPVGKHSRN